MAGWEMEERHAFNCNHVTYLGALGLIEDLSMATKFAEFFGALAAPIPQQQIRQRSQAGRTFSYITARVAAIRLDNVCGPEGWWDEYVPLEHSVICKLTIVLPDGSQVTKCDAGGYAGMADQGDDDKSGFSDSFKRAAAKFGIARELYNDGVADFVQDYAGEPVPQSRPSQQPARREPVPVPRQSPQANGHSQGQDNPPRTGKAMFAWLRKQEDQHGVTLLRPMNEWAKSQGFPSRMVDFDADQTADAYAEACRLIGSGREPGSDDDRGGY